MGFDGSWGGRGCPAADDIAFLVDQELLKVPLEFAQC